MRQIRQPIRLMGFVFLGVALIGIAGVVAGDECQTSQRDYQWNGYSHADIVPAVRTLNESRGFAATLLDMAPERVFRYGSVTEAMWIFDASRKFETISCEGPTIEEAQWEFAIVRVVWNTEGVSVCHVYRKTFITKEGKPNPFLDISPFDEEDTCKEFLEQGGLD